MFKHSLDIEAASADSVILYHWDITVFAQQKQSTLSCPAPVGTFIVIYCVRPGLNGKPLIK